MFALHAAPFNQVRRTMNLAPLRADIRAVMTHADWVLHPDLPALTPLRPTSTSHRYLGPLHWSVRVELPRWWHDLPGDRPLVYASLGSSGRTGAVITMLEALAELPMTVVVTTAGRVPLADVPRGVHGCEFLPADQAVPMAGPAPDTAVTVGVEADRVATSPTA